MDTALYLFGMKLYRQKDSIEFFDADFMNTIYVRSDEFKGKTLQACCNILNEYLTAHGTVGTNFKVVRLTNLEDFDLGGVVVDEGCAREPLAVKIENNVDRVNRSRFILNLHFFDNYLI